MAKPAKYKFRSSPRQNEIMRIVVAWAARGQFITLDELQPLLSFKPTRSQLHDGLYILRKHDMVRNICHGPKGAEVAPTMKGIALFRPDPIDLSESASSRSLLEDIR